MRYAKYFHQCGINSHHRRKYARTRTHTHTCRRVYMCMNVCKQTENSTKVNFGATKMIFMSSNATQNLQYHKRQHKCSVMLACVCVCRGTQQFRHNSNCQFCLRYYILCAFSTTRTTYAAHYCCGGNKCGLNSPAVWCEPCSE